MNIDEKRIDISVESVKLIVTLSSSFFVLIATSIFSEKILIHTYLGSVVSFIISCLFGILYLMVLPFNFKKGNTDALYQPSVRFFGAITFFAFVVGLIFVLISSWLNR